MPVLPQLSVDSSQPPFAALQWSQRLALQALSDPHTRERKPPAPMSHPECPRLAVELLGWEMLILMWSPSSMDHTCSVELCLPAMRSGAAAGQGRARPWPCGPPLPQPTHLCTGSRSPQSWSWWAGAGFASRSGPRSSGAGRAVCPVCTYAQGPLGRCSRPPWGLWGQGGQGLIPEAEPEGDGCWAQAVGSGPRCTVPRHTLSGWAGGGEALQGAPSQHPPLSTSTLTPASLAISVFP